VRTWRLAIVVTVAFIAAVAGVWIGRTFIPVHQAQGSELHEVLHHELKLDGSQEARIELLEQRFAVRRRALELEMRAENARLAEAIAAEHRNGPLVVAAIDASHRTMGELQKETLAHIFAMRQVLRSDQAAAFDRAVVRSLTADGR
jgi:nickel and cobalt resistance protein CnrR